MENRKSQNNSGTTQQLQSTNKTTYMNNKSKSTNTNTADTANIANTANTSNTIKSKNISKNNRGNNTGLTRNTSKSGSKTYAGFINKAKGAIESLKAPLTKLFNVEGEGMVPVESYRNELIAQEREKQSALKAATQSGIKFNEDGEPEYPAFELDDYLRGRYKIKADEFKRLQREQGFYFSDAINQENLKLARLNEGFFLKGVLVNSLADLYKHVVLAEPIVDEDGNPIALPNAGDILLSGRSQELVGEDINVDFDKIYKEKMGFHLGSDRALKPEEVLSEDNSFEKIVETSADYTGASFKRISPRSLLNMAQILDKTKHTEGQWLRVATVLEVIFKYMASGQSRDIFFARDMKLDMDGLDELAEFFRTDHLFMTLDELKAFKADLEFYRNPETKIEKATAIAQDKQIAAAELIGDV
jgi:hypothetical protein